MFSKSILVTICLVTLMSGNHAKNYGPQTFNNDYNDGGGYQDYNSQSDGGGYRAPPSAILTHKQALSHDGVFNYVFAADNGLKQGESISPDGTRTGAYQYIDTNGKTVSVKYTAGKDGFKIIEGDHAPRPQKAHKPQIELAEYQENYQPEQKYKGNGKKYPTESQQYRQPQEQDDDGQYHRETTKKQNNQFQKQNQRYTSPPQQKQQPKLFELPEITPSQLRPQRIQNGGGRGNQAEPPRTMLYNVEQRHNTNYRRYQDNGKPADGGENDDGGAAGASQDPPHSFAGGYNFEFKG